MTAVRDGGYVESALPDLGEVSLAELPHVAVAHVAVLDQMIGHPERDRQEQENHHKEQDS